MSKRFGRNQKRKMREALAAQQEQLNKLQRDLDNSRNENRMERECLEMTCELLGEYFPTLMPKTKDVNYLPVQLARTSGEDIYNMMATIHTLRGIEYRADLDRLRDTMYIRVSTPEGGTVAYNWQFRNLPSHIMERVLERDLIPMLVNEIKRGM
jgi:hypothetical protein